MASGHEVDRRSVDRRRIDDRRVDEQGVATGVIAAAVVAVLLGGTTVAYVATDGFGTRSDDTVQATDAPTQRSTDPTEADSASPDATLPSPPGPPSDGPRDGMTDGADLPDVSEMPGQRPGDGPMSMAPEVALRNGQFVVCTYTHEGYDTRVTLRHRNEYHLEQQTQGGLAHVIRAWETTFVWIDGMQEIYEYSTPLYDEIAESQMYPTFTPDDFLGSDAPEDVCHSVEDVDGAIFELPDGGRTVVPGPTP